MGFFLRKENWIINMVREKREYVQMLLVHLQKNVTDAQFLILSYILEKRVCSIVLAFRMVQQKRFQPKNYYG